MILDKVKDILGIGNGEKKPKVKKTDLDENVTTLRDAVKNLTDDVAKLTKQLSEQKQETEEEKEEYERLQKELLSKMEILASLHKELDQVVSTRKRLLDSGPFEKVLKIAGYVLAAALVLLGIAADRESPKALKLISYITKLLPGQKA